MEREIIWTFVGGNLCALIPNKRGTGFLRQPYGHHKDQGLEDVREQIDDVDIFGLDGHLELDIHRIRDQEKFEGIVKKALTLLEAHYSCSSRESHREFWDFHPIRKRGDHE